MTWFMPRNEEILSWDPESMDKYWQQCEAFDRETFEHYIHSDRKRLDFDLQSQQAFQTMLFSSVDKQSLI